MNKRIEKVREDIRLTEKKIRELNEYLKTLKLKEKQLCDDEILKTMRQMAGKGGDVMDILKLLQSGTTMDADGQTGKTENGKTTSEKPVLSDDGYLDDENDGNGEEAGNEEE